MMSGTGAEGSEEHVEPQVDRSWADLKDAPLQFDPDFDLCGVCGDDEDVVQDEQGEGFIIPKGIPEPKAPPIEAQRRHNLTHWPYAPWCPHCVMGRRLNSPHFQARRGDQTRSLPLLVLDYCFVRNEQDQDLVTVLVGKLYPYRRTFACVVDTKGGTDGYAVDRLAEFIRTSGITRFVYKTDQESSVKHLMAEVLAKDKTIREIVDLAAQKAGKTATHQAVVAVPEHSAVGESASNARAERTVQMVEDQLRVCKAALESRLGSRVSCSHPVIRWLVEHCADIMNRFSVNKTGMSPYEELHGKKAVERRVEFGELIYYSTPKKGRAKLDLRWKIGVYLGHAWDSNELFCGTKLGNVKKARSAVRVVEGSRWNLKAVDRVIGTLLADPNRSTMVSSLPMKSRVVKLLMSSGPKMSIPS